LNNDELRWLHWHCRKACPRWNDAADPGELLGVAWEAFERARVRFDPSRGTTLFQYAHTRIQGAIHDEFRQRRVVETPPATCRNADHPVMPSTEMEELDGVEAVLRCLTDRDAGVVRECVVKGRLKQDVAAELGVSPSRITQMLKVSLATLREHVTQPERRG
jgi:RNA polymerase sigma factor (sigma-70 family)